MWYFLDCLLGMWAMFGSILVCFRLCNSWDNVPPEAVDLKLLLAFAIPSSSFSSLFVVKLLSCVAKLTLSVDLMRIG